MEWVGGWLKFGEVAGVLIVSFPWWPPLSDSQKMQFISKNEDGIPGWRLVLDGKKTITRRTKPETPGSLRAVCPGRGKKAVGRILIISCMDAARWDRDHPGAEDRQREAEAEGFKSWDGLKAWFIKHYERMPEPLYRIKFKLVEKSEKKNGNN